MFNKNPSKKRAYVCPVGFIEGLFFIWLALPTVAGNTAHGTGKKKTLILSEKTVLKEVLSSGPFIQKVKLSHRKNLSRLLEQKHSFSNYGTFSNWTQSQSRNPQIFVFESKEKKSSNFRLGLEKNIPYGINVKSAYSTFHEKQNLSDFLKSARSPDQVYRKNLSMELNANLTSAFAQHWTLQAIQHGQSAGKWLYYEQAEELALKTAVQYWKAYLSWMTYGQAGESLKTYRKLVQQINNKKKYNFLNPGERPQILAEFENIKQYADEQKQKYENEKKNLLLILNKDPERHDIQFKKEAPPPPPDFLAIQPENTRTIKIKKKQAKQQEFKLKTAKTQLFPGLNLTGKGGFIPASVSDKNLSFSKKHSFYEWGLSLNWVLFSKSFYEKVNQEEYQWEENKIELAVAKQELSNQLSSLKHEIALQWEGIQRAKKAGVYQKQAFQELKRSFDQGRVDIFELINTENKLREAELKKVRALSAYSLSRLRLLALRDQLVEPYLKP